jgi:hypothetical protein
MTRMINDGTTRRATSLAGRLSGLLTTYRQKARRRWLVYVTERAVAELSPQMRKDIGWPTRFDEC